MGVYGGSTFHQGDPQTPPPHPAPPTSQCVPASTIGGTIAASSSLSPSSSSAYTLFLTPLGVIDYRLLQSRLVERAPPLGQLRRYVVPAVARN